MIQDTLPNGSVQRTLCSCKLGKAVARGWQPRFRHTDIVGALQVASQLFNKQPVASKQLLVIYSDMRNSTPDLDLESAPPPLTRHCLDLHQSLFPSLRGVTVHVRGVDAADKSIGYWQALRDFWSVYFKTTTATFVGYCAFRDVIPTTP